MANILKPFWLWFTGLWKRIFQNHDDGTRPHPRNSHTHFELWIGRHGRDKGIGVAVDSKTEDKTSAKTNQSRT